jgi:hypothetical protein
LTPGEPGELLLGDDRACDFHHISEHVFVFPALISLRRKYPDVPRPYRVPGEVAEVPRAAAPADPAPGGP